MTLELKETKKFLSKQEILDCFKGIGQTELPLREQVLASKKSKKEPKKHVKKLIIPRQRKKVSQSYLCNLNPRIEKAQKIWNDTWAHERGDLLRSVGITDLQTITVLSDNPDVPECLVNHYISK